MKLKINIIFDRKILKAFPQTMSDIINCIQHHSGDPYQWKKCKKKSKHKKWEKRHKSIGNSSNITYIENKT